MAKKPASSGTSPGLIISIFIIGILGLVGYFQPGVALLLAVGLAPTFISWMLDAKAHRGIRLRAIFTFNLSGVMPYISDVLGRGGEIADATIIIADKITLIIMYSPVLGASLALWAGPFASAFVSTVIAGDRLRRVVNNQKDLIEIWGPDIAGGNKEFFLETGTAIEREKAQPKTPPTQPPQSPNKV